MKKTEDRRLSDFHEWVWNTYPYLRRLCFHPLNEQGRGGFEGARNKAKGVVSGVADYICLIKGKDGQNGLCIEFKTETGVQSPNQIDFEEKVKGQGFEYRIAKSTEEGMQIFLNYIGG